MSQFTRMTGGSYLNETLKTLIEQVIADPVGYEVDPEKAPGENHSENMRKLISMTNNFLDAIINSFDWCPLPFRIIASHLQEEVFKKYPQSKHTAIGGFIFLRFFCPGVMSPDSQGILTEGVIDGVARRALILISKSLQNLSNGLEFGKKEPFMEDMNVFIRDNMPRVQEYFDRLAAVPPSDDYPPLSSPEQAVQEQLPVLHEKIVQNLEKIAKNLLNYKQDAILPNLCHILANLGEVNVEIEQIKKQKKN